MLYQPDHKSLLRRARALILSWNADADYFRRAACATRHGLSPTRVVTAARNVQTDLAALLDQVEQALTVLPAAHPDFRDLLWARVAAISLSASISKSLDMLEAISTSRESGPCRPTSRPQSLDRLLGKIESLTSVGA